MTDKEKRELKDGVISIFKRFNILDHTATIGGLRDDILRYIDSLQEEPKKCMYSKDNYTDEDRKVLCEGCEEECEYSKQSVDEVMAEIEEKAKAFTRAHKGESADKILSEMRGEKPVSEDLEEEVYEHLWKGRMGTDVSRPIYLSYDELVAVARHFTNWQKGQMIKEAVKGEVGEYYPTTIHLDKDIPELKHFDKVKIIIIKEG